jgi:excisionase family DNA binding protein
MDEDLISIGEASEILGVSIGTLRRWDKNRRFSAEKSAGDHRRYSKVKIELYLNDIFVLAKDWCVNGTEIPEKFYCPNTGVFQARLNKMRILFEAESALKDISPLVGALAGEIGDNSFAHNLGNWPDIPGIFFGYDFRKHKIVLADRGIGILATLKRVKPELRTHDEALLTAFTEVISGRAPEERGNGLKFVRKVIMENPMGLLFQTGDAELNLVKDGRDLKIQHPETTIRGCLALLTF